MTRSSHSETSERSRIVLQSDDIDSLLDELDAFWTYAVTINEVELKIVAEEGFVEAFDDENELEGVHVEEMADYEE